MPKMSPLALLPVAMIALIACTSGGSSPSPSASGTPPSSSPESPASSPSPVDFGDVDHATGKTDVVLRYEEGGGFVMPAFLAIEAPIFTLYGDGTIIFRDPFGDPPAAQGSVMPLNPFRIAKLSEEQIQETLKLALGEGGLAIAKPVYENNQVADASTTVFTIDAGGIKKTVSIYALGLEVQGAADAPARAAFARLAERLRDFDQGGTIATDLYEPTAYRGVLMDGFDDPNRIDWPWTDIAPSDFVFPADPNAFQRADRVMTPDEVAALGLEEIEGGFQGLTLVAPDEAKVYSFALRPLLPDETS